MSEGSLEAPIRHPIDWHNPEFYDEAKLDDELRRVFDICHGCRRCFNLCDSFPHLFDLIDDSETEELDSVSSADFKPVVDACTLCDMCFLTKCPYVPPHEFNLDFPHLMLRYRAIEHKKGETKTMDKMVSDTDMIGKMGTGMASIANWAVKSDNSLTRGMMESVTGIHKEAALPKFSGKTLEKQIQDTPPKINTDAPAHGRKAVVYATCYGNYNSPEIGNAALSILAHNGVEVEVLYPECCGMPQLEQGDLSKVDTKAKNVAKAFKPYIEKGYDVISLVPSCTLMLKFEWPLIVDGDEDVKLLSGATYDISQYIVDIAKKEGLAEGLNPMDGDISVHIACHSRAQNMGQKAAELLRLIPDVKLNVVERCSGHGGSWGVKKDFFEVGMKVGKPVFRQALNKGAAKYVASECPLAGLHIAQGMERMGSDNPLPETVPHPVILFAKAYGLHD